MAELARNGERSVTYTVGFSAEDLAHDVAHDDLQYARVASIAYETSDYFFSNNTDGPGNPLSKGYTRAAAADRLQAFGDVTFAVRHLNLSLYFGGQRLARSHLGGCRERLVGWHLYVYATKHSR